MMERKACALAAADAPPASAASQTYSPESRDVGLPMARRLPKLRSPPVRVTPFLFQLTRRSSSGLGGQGEGVGDQSCESGGGGGNSSGPPHKLGRAGSTAWANGGPPTPARTHLRPLRSPPRTGPAQGPLSRARGLQQRRPVSANDSVCSGNGGVQCEINVSRGVASGEV